jgi:hypothetical protein
MGLFSEQMDPDPEHSEFKKKFQIPFFITLSCTVDRQCSPPEKKNSNVKKILFENILFRGQFKHLNPNVGTHEYESFLEPDPDPDTHDTAYPAVSRERPSILTVQRPAWKA